MVGRERYRVSILSRRLVNSDGLHVVAIVP